MEVARNGRLVPAPEEKVDHGHRLHQLSPQGVGGRRGRGHLVLGDVDPQDSRIAAATGPPQPLAQGGDGRRSSDLHNAAHVADVDAHLECRGADRIGRLCGVLQSPFDELAQLL